MGRLRVACVVGALVALVPLMLLRRVEANASRDLLETNESRYYLPGRGWLVPLSLGYREAAAGVIWARTLTYFGEEMEKNGPHEHLERYIVAVTELDPYFYHAYTWGSAAAIYNNTAIDREAVEMSIRLLERGIEVFPDDGELRYQLGFQLYFELPPVVSPEEAEQARRRGAEETCTGAILGGGPHWLPLVCSSLATRHGLDGLAQERLLASLAEADDERTRTRIEERLESLMTPDQAFRALQRISEHRRRWQSEMPYAPGAFYAIAGPVPPVPLADEVEMPLPMDAIIAAAMEDLLYGDEPEESAEAAASEPEAEAEPGPEAEAEPR